MKRITKRAARKLWAEGQTITLCPCKMYPGGMWTMGCPVNLAEWRDSSRPELTDQELFNTVCTEFAWYNCTYETGYYPAFYI